MTTGTFTPTDEDVERALAGVCDSEHNSECKAKGWGPAAVRYRHSPEVRAVLATIGPIIERERRAAKVEALRYVASGQCGLSAHMSVPLASILHAQADAIEQGAR